MTITKNTIVGDIVTEHPITTRVFNRHRIDYCCGGKEILETACGNRQLNVSEVINELECELENREFLPINWGSEPLSDLIKHLIEEYHRPLERDLFQILEMMDKVIAAHGTEHGESLGQLRQVFSEMDSELRLHLRKEEDILFPMIQAGEGCDAAGPMNCMQHEHQSAGQALKKIRELANEFIAPEGACTTWAALWARLEIFEEELMNHIHLENNVLFPRALNEN